MAPRLRVVLIVAAVAVAAAGATVGATLLQTDEIDAPTPRAGLPPLFLDLGVRTDSEARLLRRAAGLYARDQPAAAGRLFARSTSVQARVGAAMASWPDGTIEDLGALAASEPRNALVRLNYGVALFWFRRNREAEVEWRAAARLGRDSASGVQAATFLHPDIAPGLPILVPSFEAPPQIARLRADRQLAALTRRARGRNVRDLLLYGVALQRLGRPRSAARVYARAVRLAPRNAEAQVAAAVGLFDKERPSRAFARLGPLTRQFPRSASVRFHLGLLLLWIRRVEAGKAQIEQARSLAPRSRLGREADGLLRRLESRTGEPKR